MLKDIGMTTRKWADTRKRLVPADQEPAVEAGVAALRAALELRELRQERGMTQVALADTDPTPTTEAQAYSDPPNTHKYGDAPDTSWAVYTLDHLTNDGPVTHYYHIPTAIRDAIEAEARTDPAPRLVRVEIGVIEGWSDKPSARLSETAEMEAYFADVPRVGDYIGTAYGTHRIKTVFWMLDGSPPVLRLDTIYTGEDSMDTALGALAREGRP